jgi:hypothetical protein
MAQKSAVSQAPKALAPLADQKKGAAWTNQTAPRLLFQPASFATLGNFRLLAPPSAGLGGGLLVLGIGLLAIGGLGVLVSAALTGASHHRASQEHRAKNHREHSLHGEPPPNWGLFCCDKPLAATTSLHLMPLTTPRFQPFTAQSGRVQSGCWRR